METAPQSRWTHKHCETQCISVEPPSSSLRPSPLLVWLSAPSRLRLPYRRERYWSQRSSPNNCKEGLLQLYKEGLTNKEGLCSVDLSVEWTIMGGRRGDRIHEEGKDRSKRPLPLCGVHDCNVFHSTVHQVCKLMNVCDIVLVLG